MKYTEAHDINSYLKVIPPNRRPQLEEIRQILQRSAPAAIEEYNYNMLYYPLDGPLFALASQKHFMALYVTYHDLVERYKPQLGKASFGKSCIRFKKLENLNLDAVEALVQECYERRLRDK